MNKLVSVIIPTYKRPQALIKAIASVQAQSYSYWEVIIVDDNDPTDDARKQTSSVMAIYNDDMRIKYICHDVNKGACKARNTGLDAAKGEFVAFLDDDDLWIETKLEVQVAALSHSDAQICYSDMYQEYRGLRRYFTCVDDSNLYMSLLKQGFGICTSALLISTQAMRSVGGFDNNLPSMQDYDLLLRLTKKYTAIRIAKPLLTYQLADDGISCNPVTKANGHYAIIKKYKVEYKRLGLFKGLSRQFESLADFELRSNNRFNSIKYYIKALIVSRFSFRVIIKMIIGTLFGKAPLECYLQRRLQRLSTHVENDS